MTIHTKNGFLRSIVPAIALGIAPAAAGCGASPTETDTTAAAAHAVAEAKGPASGLRAALDAMALRPDQKAKTDRAIADAEAKLAPVREARLAFARELAAGIRAGRIDRAKAQARIDELVRSIATAVPTLESSLDALYAALDTDQRETLVDAVREGLSERRARRGGGHGQHGHHGKFKAIVEDLQLTSEQKERLREVVGGEMRRKRAEHKERFGDLRERLHAAADAFVEGEFRAGSFGLGREAPAAARAFTEGLVRIAELGTPILDPAQRAKVAALLEQRAAEME